MQLKPAAVLTRFSIEPPIVLPFESFKDDRIALDWDFAGSLEYDEFDFRSEVLAQRVDLVVEDFDVCRPPVKT